MQAKKRPSKKIPKNYFKEIDFEFTPQGTPQKNGVVEQ